MTYPDNLLKIAILSLFLVISCDRNEPDARPEVPEQEITVYTAVAPSARTKASFNEGAMYWEAGDRILVYDGNASYEFETNIEGRSNRADFTYQGDYYSAEGPVMAFHPADGAHQVDFKTRTVKVELPSEQKSLTGGYDPDVLSSVVLSETKVLDFNYLYAFVKYTVRQEGIRSISFSGNAYEVLSGCLSFEIGRDGRSSLILAEQESREVTLTADNGSFLKIGQTYFLAVAPCELESGFKIVAETEDDRIVRTYYSSYELQSGHILDTDAALNVWDSSLTDNKDDVPSEECNDGWIRISRPEHFAALLVHGGEEGSKYRICADLDMSMMPQDICDRIDGEQFFRNITIDGYDERLQRNHIISGITLCGVGGVFPAVEDFTISNLDICKTKIENDAYDGTGILIGNASGSLDVSGVHIYDSDVRAPCKVGGMIGAIYEGIAIVSASSFNGGSVCTTWVEGVSGQCGGFLGYAGRRDEGPYADRSTTVDVSILDSNVMDTSVEAYISDISRPAGIFVGSVNGYDSRERLCVNSCVSTAALEIIGGLTDFQTRYRNECRAEFSEPLAVEGLLGGSAYCRAEVVFDDRPFVPAWDGTRVVTPLSAIYEYDYRADGLAIYSAEDMAFLQGKDIDSDSCYLLADVDMGGSDDVIFSPILSVFHFDGLKKEFIGSSELTKNSNHSIYHCKVVLESHDGIGAGFIKSVSKEGTIHSNLNLIGADINCHHDESIPEPGQFESDNGAGNAYAGMFVSRVSAPYSVSNVHMIDGRVKGLCKVGGLIGMVTDRIDMENCSVSDCLIENYEANIKNYYSMQASVSSYVVYANEWWYTQGECGGLIGFLMSPDALIKNCSVTDSRIDCFGQPNKEVTAGVYDSGFTPENPTRRIASGKTLVAGRHVNQFIGDVRSIKSTDMIVIEDYYVSGNTYFGVPAETNDISSLFDNTRRHHYLTDIQGNHHYCNCVGQAYYVGVDVNVNLIIFKIEKHIADYAGTLVFNTVNEESVTISETVGNGNDDAWTGGDFYISGFGY